MPESVARRAFLHHGAKAALAVGAPYLASRFPQAYAAEEMEIPVGVATNPLGPDDLENGNWLKPEYWEDDSLEFKFPNASKLAYFRSMWTQKDSIDYAAFLIDFVGNSSQKPTCKLMMVFDTFNQRLEGKDPNATALPGVYGFSIKFDKPGGSLYETLNPFFSPFPSDPHKTLFYTWARAHSPLSHASGARLDPHNLLGVLIRKEVITSKYEEIGVQAFLWNSLDNVGDITHPFMLLPSASDWAKLSFKSYRVDETPWPAIALAAATGAAAVAARKMSRRQLVFPWSK